MSTSMKDFPMFTRSSAYPDDTWRAEAPDSPFGSIWIELSARGPGYARWMLHGSTLFDKAPEFNSPEAAATYALLQGWVTV